jgi:hypothetical protein
VLVALAIVSFYTSISGLIKVEMFPAEVRALGVGLSYAIANAIFGGSAEFVALSLKSVGSESMFYWYVTALAGNVRFMRVSRLRELQSCSFNDERRTHSRRSRCQRRSRLDLIATPPRILPSTSTMRS